MRLWSLIFHSNCNSYLYYTYTYYCTSRYVLVLSPDSEKNKPTPIRPGKKKVVNNLATFHQEIEVAGKL